MHVLMSAYNCDPRRGSDAQIGWRWPLEVARLGVRVTVLTDAHNRDAIEAASDHWRGLPVRFVYVALPGWNWPRAWRDSAPGLLLHPLLWQRASLRAARRMLAGVDLIHHVTNVTLTHGNALSRLPRPFVFGPVGGGETAPPELAAALSFTGRVWEKIKRFTVGHLESYPLCGPTLRRAAVVVGATAETVAVARRLGARRIEQMLDYGTSEPGAEPSESSPGSLPSEPAGPVVLMVGSMVYNPKKGYGLGRMVLDRLLARHPDLRVVVTGRYPGLGFLRGLVASGRLDWRGATPFERMPAIYRQASVLLYPSLRESTGSALMEGLAHGLPVAGVRVNSRASLPPEVGVLVSPGELEAVVEGLTVGIGQLLADPVRRLEASAAASGFARTQTWQRHASHMVQQIYPAALRGANVPPSGGPPSVLLVSEPGVDGVFRHVEALTNALLDADLPVHLAFSRVRGSPALERLVARVEASGGRTLDLGIGNAPGPRDAVAFARLAALARTVRPDVVHAHSSKAGALARALIFVGVRARFIYTPHAYYQMHGSDGSRGGGLKHRVFTGVERALGGVGTTVNLSVSESAYARDQLGLSSAKMVLIPNGIDTDRFRPAATPQERRTLRAELDLPPDALLLGTVARLSPQKDPETLYRAVLAALAERTDLHFAHLNATGEGAAVVENLLAAAPPDVRARVHLRPAVEEPSRFYRALDAFTLPSRYEGLSLAALEAAATGLPLILSDAPGNADLRAHGFDRIWWTTPGDARSLTEKILAWAGEGAGAAPGQPIPSNHQQVARRDFARQRQIEQTLRCYAGAALEAQTDRSPLATGAAGAHSATSAGVAV